MNAVDIVTCLMFITLISTSNNNDGFMTRVSGQLPPLYPPSSSAVVQNLVYRGYGCNASSIIDNFTTNFTTGVCQEDSSGSSAYYCDSVGQYVAIYSDLLCQTLAMITRLTPGCYPDGNGYSHQHVCQNPQLGPVAPFTWPPQGYIIESECPTPTQCYSYATPNNVCIPDSSIPNAGRKLFCTSDSNFLGMAEYADTDCSSDELLWVLLQNITSSNTIQCAGPMLSDSLPFIGVVSYTSYDCADDSVGSVTFMTPGACFEGSSHSCSASGSTFTTMLYGDSPAPNQCSHFLGNTTYPDNECQGGHMYFCSGFGPL